MNEVALRAALDRLDEYCHVTGKRYDALLSAICRDLWRAVYGTHPFESLGAPGSVAGKSGGHDE